MKYAALLLIALSACGGGGGSSVPEKAEQPVSFTPPIFSNPNCQAAAENHIACDLVSGKIGANVPSGAFASFTNNTGTYLQIDHVSAFTGERQYWSEYCAYLTNFATAQMPAGKGEVGCGTKNIGEDYSHIRWGDRTGLSVAPGETIHLNSHTVPDAINHTYSLTVAAQATGVHSWRQPQVDRVIPCDGQLQHTDMVPWQNTTGRDLHLIGASIYAETPSSRTPNELNGSACIYVLQEGGAQKYSNCDGAVRTRGQVSFPLVTVAPGEFIAAQATNYCQVGSHWNWVAFLNVW